MNTKKYFISLISALVLGVQLTFAAGTPENVTGIEATAVDSSSIGVTWNSALDGEGGVVDHYRIYYATFSVFGGGGPDYENTVDTPDSNTNYVVTGLNPDTTYYFSVTAISSDDKESEEYGFETSATTQANGGNGGGDTESPTVVEVTAPDKMHVKVAFNEAVQLPLLIPEASFTVVEQINPANSLTVNAAAMDPSDAENKTVLLTVDEQTANVNYILTAGVAIKDLAGNPIISGSTDTGLFLGSSEDEGAEEPAGEPEAPAEEPGEGAEASMEKEACDKDMNCFVGHLADCSLAEVTEEDQLGQYTYTHEITGKEGVNCKITLTADKHPNILYAGSSMECNLVQGAYTAQTYKDNFDVANCSGNLAEGFQAIIAADTTPPEDVTNLLLSFREELEKFVVIMNWTASIDSAKDLVDQVMYMSLDRGTSYDTGTSLGATAANHEVADLNGGTEYTFKITTKDAAGNESVGVVKSIRLPATGMGAGLALLGSALASSRVLRRKRRD